MDLNSDLGESYGAWRMGDDAAMLAIVSSANVACGFHAGDPLTILATLREAAARGVAVGAHVSYPDRVGFGRRRMDVAPAELTADVIYQIGALQGLAAAAGTRVRYVKPHGALYNTIADDAVQADAVIAGIRAIDPSLVLMALAGAPILERARAAGLRVVAEAFADRAYTPTGALVSRREPGAVLHDPDEVAARMLRLATDGVIEAADGSDAAARGAEHLRARRQPGRRGDGPPHPRAPGRRRASPSPRSPRWRDGARDPVRAARRLPRRLGRARPRATRRASPRQPDRPAQGLGLGLPALRPTQPQALPGARRHRAGQHRHRRSRPAPTCAATCRSTAIWRDGTLAEEVADASAAWAEHPDLVAFLIGCSFTFETPLVEAGIEIRHITQGCNVPMYRTNRPCRPAGRLSGPLVVSMRPIPADRVADAVTISGRYPAVHGAPVHVGAPEALGIADLAGPDFGDPVEIRTARSRSSGPAG